MANEFNYRLDLSIIHESMDPRIISDALKHLHVRSETAAGSNIRVRNGAVFTSEMVAPRSTWLASLHDAETLYSGDQPISSMISMIINDLQPHAALLKQITEAGVISIVIGVFGISGCSACVLLSETLKQCGDLGVDLEISYYPPKKSTEGINIGESR